MSRLIQKIRLFLCNVLGWHDGNGMPITFDGASFVSRCSVCNRKVLMDSQGNWFSIAELDTDADS